VKILKEIIETLPQGKILEVRQGLHWTVVVVETEGVVQSGLASTLTSADEDHTVPDVPLAGQITDLPAQEVAQWALFERRAQASIGMATINALLPRQPNAWQVGNAEEMIAARGQGKKVALIGHFPFVNRLRQNVGELTVLELQPRPGDLPAEKTQEILPDQPYAAEFVSLMSAGRLCNGFRA
jgi:uncharacterized protein (DUF4213/DUF364 family)